MNVELILYFRCPAGVGKWASHFIQPPVPENCSVDQHYIDHIITTLAVILLPVQSRDLFLQQVSYYLVRSLVPVETFKKKGRSFWEKSWRRP